MTQATILTELHILQLRTLSELMEAKLSAVILTLKLQRNSTMSPQELADGMTAATGQLVKIGAESAGSLAKVAELEAALAAQPGVTPEVEAAFAALKAQVQAVDDLVPDATPPADPPVAP